MFNSAFSRRKFLGSMMMTGGGALIGTQLARSSQAKRKLHLACNQYPWTVFYQRENRNFNEDLDAGLAEVAA
ncbi:MAG: hypothetical protein JSU70_09710, partial [Phycisphaerales bacterium]